MKPGKPLAFGAFRSGERRIPHLGLPGNPVSSMVTFELFGRPAIQRMMGQPIKPRPVVEAITDSRITNLDDPRRFYARCILERRDADWHVRLTGGQGSGILTSMSLGNALTVIPEDIDVVEPGERIQVMVLDEEVLAHG